MPNPNLPIGGQYNVYNGARYVPVIMGEWSATVNYEPLMIVTSEGNSYTSKTFVPSGTPVSNTTYWAKTGDYNAQVEQYRKEVVNLSKQVNGAPMITPNTKFLFVGGGYPAKDFDGSVINTIVKTLGLNPDQYESFVNTSYSLQASNPQNSYDYLINQTNIIPDYVIIFGDDYPTNPVDITPFTTAITNLAVDINGMWPKAVTYQFASYYSPWNLLIPYNYIIKNLAFCSNFFGYNEVTGINTFGAYHIAKYICSTIRGCDSYQFLRNIPVSKNNQTEYISVIRTDTFRTITFSFPWSYTLSPGKTKLFDLNAFTLSGSVRGILYGNNGVSANALISYTTSDISVTPFITSALTFNTLTFHTYN